MGCRRVKPACRQRSVWMEGIWQPRINSRAMADLLLAIRSDDAAAVSAALALKPKAVNDKDSTGLTPLHHAATLPAPQVRL